MYPVVHLQNLKGPARKNLKLLLAANKRLNIAYLLKESFGQLWDYRSETWARKFFENWRAQLKWQRLKSYEKFAQMIDTHWAGIAAYSKSSAVCFRSSEIMKNHPLDRPQIDNI